MEQVKNRRKILHPEGRRKQEFYEIFDDPETPYYKHSVFSKAA